MNTARDLDLALLDAEAQAQKLFDKFMDEFYGKRQRPDKPKASLSSPTQPPVQADPNPLPAGPVGY